ncbi:unnamed protein product, partial [Schistosoma margrebowiei]
INFTATYRLDSTIHLPYGKVIENLEYHQKLNDSSSISSSISSISSSSSDSIGNLFKPRNISALKKKTVAWIVSNCHPESPRNLYAYELSKYITVSIFKIDLVIIFFKK